MTPAERLELALSYQPVDRPPWTCWYPFGLQHMSGEAQASVHLAFAERYGVDLVRVCCDYPFPLPKGVRLDRPQDFARVEPGEIRSKAFDHALTCLRKVTAGLPDRWVVDTLPSPFTTLAGLASEEVLLQALREHPGFVKPALEAITTTYERYLAKALEAGAHGVFLVVTAASHQLLSPQEYAEWSEPYDRRVLEAAAQAPCNTVYAAGTRLFLDPLKQLPCRLLGWSQIQAGPGLGRGRAGFNGAVLGGLDELHPESFPAALGRSVDEWTAPGLVLAPGGALPAQVDPRRLDDLRSAVLGLTQYTRPKPPPRERKPREPRPEPTSYPKPRTTGRTRLSLGPNLSDAGSASEGD